MQLGDIFRFFFCKFGVCSTTIIPLWTREKHRMDTGVFCFVLGGGQIK